MIPNRRTAKWTLPAGAVLAMVLQACTPEQATLVSAVADPRVSREQEQELRASREQWEGAGVADYRYTVRRTCVCERDVAGPVLVEVREGRTVSVTPVERGVELRREAFDSLDNFRELFSYVEVALNGEHEVLAAEYDSRWGYPVSLYVDPRRGEIEDERGFVVEWFEPLR
ncbi:MAG TPA: DUF6174 domain-containing protein [Longimicrobiaceae bacterium]